MTPFLPQAQYFEKINPARIMVNTNDRRKWFLPDLIHVMEMTIVAQDVSIVVFDAFKEKVIDTKIPLLRKDISRHVNMAVVLAEKKFCKEDPTIRTNYYHSGN